MLLSINATSTVTDSARLLGNAFLRMYEMGNALELGTLAREDSAFSADFPGFYELNYWSFFES